MSHGNDLASHLSCVGSSESPPHACSEAPLLWLRPARHRVPGPRRADLRPVNKALTGDLGVEVPRVDASSWPVSLAISNDVAGLHGDAEGPG